MRCGMRLASLLLAMLLCSCAHKADDDGTREAKAVPAPASARAVPYDGPVIDAHVHVFFDENVARSVNPKDPAVPARVAALLARPNFRAGVMVMALGSPEKVRAQNDALIDFVAAHPGHFAIGSVNPHHGDEALVELERIHGLGVRWLKLHPNTQAFDVADEIISRIVGRAGELGIPVTFDASMVLDADQLGKFLKLAIKHPNAQIVLAHMGMARFDEMTVLGTLELYPWWKRNLWLELSATATEFAGSPFAEKLAWVVRKVGVDRTLFGSDFPLTTPQLAIEAVESYGFTQDEMRAIFHDNARSLLGE
jgi:predicted TIM-barrel fold metal-dependent hydrolase